jgi:hypothetical protein
VGHELVDIIYHMNTRLLFDVENLVKYNKNGQTKNLQMLGKNSEIILNTPDINLIPETINRIRKNSFRIQSQQSQQIQQIQNNITNDVVSDSIVGIRIEEIDKNDESENIFIDSNDSI